MLLVIPIIISFICIYFEHDSRDTTKVYNVCIIDHDRTEMSTSLIEKIKNINEISLFVEHDLEKSKNFTEESMMLFMK